MVVTLIFLDVWDKIYPKSEKPQGKEPTLLSQFDFLLIGERAESLTNGAGKTNYLHLEEWSNPISLILLEKKARKTLEKNEEVFK